MLGIALSIGAINAMIPLIVIAVLIAAAAGSTRGNKLFELFGISTLLGINVGKGTLKGRNVYKAKHRFHKGRSPIEKVTKELVKPVIKKGINAAQSAYKNMQLKKAAKLDAASLGSTASLGAPSVKSRANFAEEMTNKFSKTNRNSNIKLSKGERPFARLVKTAVPNAVKKHITDPANKREMGFYRELNAASTPQERNAVERKYKEKEAPGFFKSGQAGLSKELRNIQESITPVPELPLKAIHDEVPNLSWSHLQRLDEYHKVQEEYVKLSKIPTHLLMEEKKVQTDDNLDKAQKRDKVEGLRGQRMKAVDKIEDIKKEIEELESGLPASLIGSKAFALYRNDIKANIYESNAYEKTRVDDYIKNMNDIKKYNKYAKTK
ncbi:MAG: hypothetical protein KGH61_01015 [Candidatus Micrarchaeota archaeon]|nr:hypothetical protein [Candidatus Micrarchaeota archaeon]MDE1847515.1 hypothetical protein [Candidatus Micrarchaeota archaeon]MDE1863849.1 hypothetical protein [Candidatus Micrarchaeota archaeon]